MKKIIVLTLLAMIVCPQISLAQFVDGSSSSKQATSSVLEKKNLFHVDYIPAKAVVSYDGTEITSTNLNGFSVGWEHLFSLGTAPLFLELGLDLDMAFDKDEDSGSSDGYKYTKTASETFMDLKVPISFSYNIAIPGTSLGFMPLAGLDFGAYLIGKVKATTKVTYKGESETVNSDSNYFDQDGYKRFIFDFHVGARILIGDTFFLEYRYIGPIANLYEEDDVKCQVKKHNIGLGFFF